MSFTNSNCSDIQSAINRRRVQSLTVINSSSVPSSPLTVANNGNVLHCNSNPLSCSANKTTINNNSLTIYPDSTDVHICNGISPPSANLTINRIAFTKEAFDEAYTPVSNRKTAKDVIKAIQPDMTCKTWSKRVRNLIPISIWLPRYDVRSCLIWDLLMGLTVAIFQVPQSKTRLKNIFICDKIEVLFVLL